MDIEKVLKKTGYTSIITSLVLGVLGLVMFMYSEATLKIIAYVLGSIFFFINVNRNYKNNWIFYRERKL